MCVCVYTAAVCLSSCVSGKKGAASISILCAGREASKHCKPTTTTTIAAAVENSSRLGAHFIILHLNLLQ